MLQKEYTEIIENAFNKYYSGELETIEERVDALSTAVKYCRLFREEHKKEYRHRFYGKWIMMREEVLEGLDKIIEHAKLYGREED